jgi:hypothetical protein
MLYSYFRVIENAFLFAKLRQFKLLLMKACERVWIEKLIKICRFWYALNFCLYEESNHGFSDRSKDFAFDDWDKLVA